MFALGSTSLKNREGVNPKLIEIDDLAITITLVDYGHGQYAGLRSPDLQNSLYLKGASERDGYERISNHQTGNALDFFAFVDGKASWKREYLAMVATAHLQAAAMLGYPVRWGGLWKTKKSKIYGWDMPHLELIL